MRTFHLCDAGDLNLETDSSGLQATTSRIVNVTGDAVINNRKKKLIAVYELDIKGTWSGQALPQSPDPFSFALSSLTSC